MYAGVLYIHEKTGNLNKLFPILQGGTGIEKDMFDKLKCEHFYIII